MSDMRLLLERRQRKTGLPAELIARDMMQARTLSAMFDGAAKRELVLKGGLAMRTAHGSHRFTKDIDLQASPETPMARVKAIVESAVKAAVAAGIIENVQIGAPKQTDTVQRWKVGGTIVGGGSEVHMTIEVSRRGMPDPKLISSVAYAPAEGGSKAVMLEVYSPTGLAASKVGAFLSPNRMAARDIYDLNLLITMRVDPPVELLRRLGKDAIVEGLKEVWSKLELMTWDIARNDLKPFLIKEQADLLTEESWDEMRLRTGEAMTAWLRDALETAEPDAEQAGPVVK